MASSPLVSIIVTTYESERTIEKVLQSIKNQDYSHIETILVDNFSSDATLEIGSKYTKNLYTKWPERTAQKNFWILNANGEYICMIDADMYLQQHTISECVQLMQETPNTNGWVCIPVMDIWDSFWTKVIAYERSFHRWTQIEAARFLKKELVERVWWYQDIIFYEEFIVPQKIAKLWYNVKLSSKSWLFHDYHDFTLFLDLKKKFYYWKSLSSYKKHMKTLWLTELTSDQTSICKRYALFLWNKNFYKKPLLGIAVLILKTLEFWSWWLGILFQKFSHKNKT